MNKQDTAADQYSRLAKTRRRFLAVASLAGARLATGSKGAPALSLLAASVGTRAIRLSIGLFWLAASLGSLHAQASLNMELLGNWDDNSLVTHAGLNYNDVWGYAADDREYGLIGSARFVHILDITNPTTIAEIGRFNTFNSSNSLWRDIKTYQHYAYCVADQQAEGLQIIDLSNLPQSASIVYQSTAFFSRCHNIYIDEAAAKLYVFGSNNRSTGVIVLSLANPAQPSLLASVTLNGGYMHDGFVRGDTLYANHGTNGLYVYNMATPSSPIELGRLTSYPEAGYNHSCWLTDTGNHLVFCDETPGRGVKIAAVSDPADISVTDVFRSNLEAPIATNSLAHNPIVMGDSLVFISYYDDGIQVFDISDPSDVLLRGYYDTNPSNLGTYPHDGAWGVYPLLPSGRLLGSDILNGLFVLSLDNFTEPLPVSYLSWEAHAQGEAAVLLRWQTAQEINNQGFTIEHSTDGRQFAPIGWQPAIATEGQGTNYHFLHQPSTQGLQYYRLQQVDYDGSYQRSSILSVRLQATSSSSSSPWPNPLPLGQSLQGLVEPATYYNALGQAIPSQQLNTPGWYWLQDGHGHWHRLLLVR